MAAGGRKEKREAKYKDIMQDASGNVIYTGELWRISESGGPGSDRRQRAVLTGGLAVLALIVIGSGCIDAKNAMGAFYVVLPYIGEVSALFGLAWNAVKLIFPSEGVRTYVLEHCSARIPAACRILTVFALAGCALSILYLILNGADGRMGDSLAYLMLKIAAAAIAEWYRRLFKSIDWTIR